jgi:CubicO group peptidase (beta-lactamase class C family)
MIRVLQIVFFLLLFHFLFQPGITICGPSPVLKGESTKSLQEVFPVAEGWSSEKLALAMLFAEEIGSSSVIVLHKGKLVLEWGNTTLRINSASVRKSLLSAIYGVAVDKGLLDISLNLGQLGIDDRPPTLSAKEKEATVEHLLKARSGVYHTASAETVKMKSMRPKRGSFDPNEHWYYNNWDFNVLGTIFERQTNIPIEKAFKKWIADPIGMQDFREEDVHYRWTSVSLHPYFIFWISARDLARFGQLYLQKGMWQGKQVMSEEWILASTHPHSVIQDGGYGYMWWIRPDGSYYAAGYHGQYVLILPKEEIVIVNRVFSGTPGFKCLPEEIGRELEPLLNPVSHKEFISMVEMILEAGPEHVRW